MDDVHFDDLARTLAVPTRRSILSALSAILLAAVFTHRRPTASVAKSRHRASAEGARRHLHAEAKKHRHGRRKKKPNPLSPPALIPPPPIVPPPPPPDGCNPPCGAGQGCVSGDCVSLSAGCEQGTHNTYCKAAPNGQDSSSR